MISLVAHSKLLGTMRDTQVEQTRRADANVRQSLRLKLLEVK